MGDDGENKDIVLHDLVKGHQAHEGRISHLETKLGIKDGVDKSDYVTVKQFDNWREKILMPEIKNIGKWVRQIKNWIYILIASFVLLGGAIKLGLLKVGF